MAYVKLGSTKSANRLISYAEKRANISNSLNCDCEYAKTQLRVTRELWGKNDNIQAHHVIQSFKPEETTAEKANAIGLELAEKLFKGYEVAVYTHTDKKHIHNHIVVNSVNFENGRKLQLHGKKALDLVRSASDALCVKYNLSKIEKENSNIRYTLAEKGMLEKGKTSWKDELRQAIDLEKVKADSFSSFKKALKEKYNITVTERGKNIIFSHPEQAKNVRGTRLGADYEKGSIENVISRQIKTSGSNSKRTTSRIEQAEPSGTGKQFTEREFDGVHSIIREIEERAEQFSPTARAEAREREKAEQAKLDELARAEQAKLEELARAEQAKLDELARAKQAKLDELAREQREMVERLEQQRLQIEQQQREALRSDRNDDREFER